MEELIVGLFVFNICSAGMLGFLLLFADSQNRAANRFAGSALLLILACGASAVFSESVGHILDLPARWFEFNLGLTVVILMVMYGERTLGEQSSSWLWGLVVLDVLLGVCCNVADFVWLHVVLWPGLVAIQVALAISLYRRVVQYGKVLKQYHSELQRRTLTWIGWLFAALIVYRSLEMMVVVATIGLERGVFDEEILGLPWSLSVVSMTVEVLIELVAMGIIFWVGHHAFVQIPCELPARDVAESEQAAEGSPTGNLVPSEDAERFNQLVARMVDLKAWRKQDLTLGELAMMLDMGEKELSRVLNHREDSSFYQLINEMRVADFKSLMEEQEASEYSIFGLAMESGFRSKTTFYKAFRTVEGMTPTAYMSQRNNASD